MLEIPLLMPDTVEKHDCHMDEPPGNLEGVVTLISGMCKGHSLNI